jgi:hypothetical protein
MPCPSGRLRRVWLGRRGFPGPRRREVDPVAAHLDADLATVGGHQERLELDGDRKVQPVEQALERLLQLDRAASGQAVGALGRDQLVKARRVLDLSINYYELC